MRAPLADAVVSGQGVRIALQTYASILELLQWGHERFKDVSYKDKGTIFEPTFIRGVKHLRLDALVKVCVGIPYGNQGTCLTRRDPGICAKSWPQFSVHT